MQNWTETYRGTVPPWQCDVTEHFTISPIISTGSTRRSRTSPRCWGSRRDLLQGSLAFIAASMSGLPGELRAGSSFHVESAAIGIDGGLRLGHSFVDSANGETVTWIEEGWDLAAAPLSPEQQSKLATPACRLGGPGGREAAGTEKQCRVHPDRARPGEARRSRRQWPSRARWPGWCTGLPMSCIQAGSAIGMDAEYMEKSRRGFSTFELALQLYGSLRRRRAVSDRERDRPSRQFLAAPRASAVLTRQSETGEVARLGQYGVNLDLEARRRPAKFPR